MCYAAPTELLNLDQRHFLIRQPQNIAQFSFTGYDSNWRWLRIPKPRLTETATGSLYQYGDQADDLIWKLQVTPTGNTVQLDTDITANRDQKVVYLALVFSFIDQLTSGRLEVTSSGQQTSTLPLPLARAQLTGVTQFSVFDDAGSKQFTLSLQTPADIHIDKTLRIKLVSNAIAKGEAAHNRLTLTFAEPPKFYASLDERPGVTSQSHWYPFTPNNQTAPGEFGLQDWLKLPTEAITARGASLFADNQPFKVWGTNVEYQANAPSHAEAEQRAAFFAKYGINGVRLHKLTNPGWQGLGNKHSASDYDPKRLELFDYFTAQLRNQQITYGLSPIWQLQVFDGDREKLLAYDEVKKAGSTRGLIWFAKDVQDLHIATMLNLLNHKNPYTGLKYADDPAVTYFEIQNEEDVFFFSTGASVARSPTYYALLAGQFSDWLLAKYGSQAGLEQAWGKAAINAFKNEGGASDEALSKRNIFPVGNPWLWDNQIQDRARGRRLQDTARFLFELQNNYYQRASEAIRAAGFRGQIVASNWQAGSGSAHFLNLISDAEHGMIDRHNYMGGASGTPGNLGRGNNYAMQSGFQLNNYTMLPEPGSGLLSVGMQQVQDKPFLLSEWMSVVPSEWAAADTTIIAAYGMGLQDWDMSYHFASNASGFTPSLTFPGPKKFNNLTPVGVGLYPVLSRMVLRGDVAPGQVIATRRVSLRQAYDSDFDFTNITLQENDFKSFSGTPSHNALAAGQVLVQITDDDQASSIGDWQQYQQGDTITASTGQLKWTGGKEPHSGFIEINTGGTQGVAGFAEDRQLAFNDMTITPHSNYAVILTTAKARQQTLASDKQVLIVAMARAYNSGMVLTDDLIIEAGKAPVVLEPVQAELAFKRRQGKVTVLDHDGLRTNKSYRLEDGQFQLDTGRDQSPYYLVEFD